MGERMRIVIVGSGGVGKSALTIRFLQNKFIQEYDPTIEDTYRKTMTIDKKSVFLDILDTAGQEEYTSMENTYYRSGDGFVCVYSITSTESYKKMKECLKNVLMNKDRKYFPIIIVGNKCDLKAKREVTATQVARDFKKTEYQYIETSALEGINIDKIFIELVRTCRKYSLLLKEQEKKEKSKKKSKKNCIIM
ncbi:ras-like protein [Anaeramoeba flamelloides]|uniref:Ras-like protein n=1 Tax=Anaeramoeba flamelloides TaxID=1746091 RepID=A0ABQ8Z5I2_9EUKA|nr:ras-like protein [Anaeramoeba flamelloides]